MPLNLKRVTYSDLYLCRQEQLLLNIFAAIMSQNYTLVTSIDYGRIYVSTRTDALFLQPDVVN